MIRRAALLVALALGLLLPRGAVVLAELAGLERAVICRGDALVTVTLGPDGAPVEAEPLEHGPCLAAHASPAPPSPAPGWFAPSFAPPPAARPLAALPGDALWRGPPPERGPPARA